MWVRDSNKTKMEEESIFIALLLLVTAHFRESAFRERQNEAGKGILVLAGCDGVATRERGEKKKQKPTTRKKTMRKRQPPAETHTRAM